jgi:hypothetical protein
MTAVVYAGRFERGKGPFVCPLCAGQFMHNRTEHRTLFKAIRYPLQVELWGDDDLWVISRGHHPPERFLAVAAADPCELLTPSEMADLTPAAVRHVWLRFRPAPKGSEDTGRWWKTSRGPGAVPFTMVELP